MEREDDRNDEGPLAARSGAQLTESRLIRPPAPDAAGPIAPHSLDQVLSKMEANGKNFQSMQASLERTKVTVIVNDKAVDSGTVYFTRKGKDPRIMVEITNRSSSGCSSIRERRSSTFQN